MHAFATTMPTLKLLEFAQLHILLALGSACLFGVTSVIAKRGLRYVEAQTGALITIGVTTLVYLGFAPLWTQASDWFGKGFWIFVLNGLIHPMFSMYLSFEATSRTGPTVAATFASTAPLFAAVTAIVFLGESLSPSLVVGTLGIVIGIMTLSWQAGGATRLLRLALLFATGAAVVRGLNHTIGKWGLEYLPNAVMAGFVSFAVSFTGSLIVFKVRHGNLPQRIPLRGLLYFAGAGITIAGAIACMYGALSLGTVVVVSPLVNTYPIFTLLMSTVLGDERISLRILLGVAVVVLGVVVISAAAH